MDHSQHQCHNSHDHGNHHRHHELMFRRKFWISLLISLPVLVYSEFIQTTLGYTAPAFPGSQYVTPLFSIIVFLYGGLPFLKMAKGELQKQKPGMMMLISLAILVAFIYSLGALFLPDTTSFFWELVTLIDIMLLGHWIEMRSVRKASGALDQLAQLMPDTAERITADGETEEVPVSALDEGDTVLVRPGSSVPADGEVIDGESHVNEAMITGESKPVAKSEGSDVIGGTINQDGSLRVKITATGDKTALAGIMKLVEEAQESKSETQLLADKAAGWLFYIALGTAAITATAWIIATGFNLTVLERAVTVLVIACPHALGLAIPLVVAINTSLAAQNGMLVRDRIAMEEARNIDTVVFDKTGTLTEGKQSVVAFQTAEDWSDDTALAYMDAVEQDSEHMIAQAIRQKADEEAAETVTADRFEAIKGKGVKARVEEKDVHVGGPNLLAGLDLELPDTFQTFRDEHGAKGRTTVYLIVEGTVVAAAALADRIRPESYEAVAKLHGQGIEVAMITGDSEDVAEAVADELDIDTYFAEVLPEDKDKKVQELQEAGKKVAMVGDGVNDAPALTRADIGIAIGSGTDVAVESADIVLVKNNPMDIVSLIALSKASYRKMQQNLVWATGYNVIALPLAAGVLASYGIILSPAIGAVVMSLSTVIVAVNAQLLRRISL